MYRASVEVGREPRVTVLAPTPFPWGEGIDMTDDTRGANKVGDLVDALGCELELDENDMPYGAIVLLAVTGEDGTVLRTALSDGLDWLTIRGMLVEAERLAANGWSAEP